MKKMILIMAIVIGYSLTLLTTPMPCIALPLGEVAIYTQRAGWMGLAAAVAEGKELADLLKKPSKVVNLNDQEIGDWAEKHTDNGLSDIIVTFGDFPAALYPPGNAKPDGSIAENFLEGGNVFLNTADYIFYVVEGAGTNGENGLKNMMDINADMWGDNTAIKPTADGAKYTPTLAAFTTARPFKTAQIVDPWEVEVAFGDNGSGFLDPAIVHDTETDGRIGILYQAPGNDALPRGKVLAEMIDNFLFEVLGAQAVDPQQKATTTWGHLKSDF